MAKSTNRELPSLTLFDFSDRDLMYALEDCYATSGDRQGRATSKEVAEFIGIDRKNGASCVGSRFAWWKKNGLAEAEIIDGEACWKMTKLGQELMKSREMTKTIMDALNRLNEGQRVRLIEEAARQVRTGSSAAGFVSKRAWRRELVIAA